MVFEGNQQNIEGHLYSYEDQTSCPGNAQNYEGHQLNYQTNQRSLKGH